VQKQKQTYVIAKHVLDQLQRISWNNFVEDDLLLLYSRCFQLLLNETGTVLVTAKFHYVTENVLKYGL